MAGEPSLRTDTSPKSALVVLLDTNFLLLPFQRRIDIFEEIGRLVGEHVEFLVLTQILNELRWLAESGKMKERRLAASSLQLVEQYCRVIDESTTSTNGLDADSALLKYASATGSIVATNDRELRHKLVKQSCRVIFLRKLAFLAITK
ncbi:MAG: PIN domain-containing protein [Promethearchaeota archaeon]